MRDSTIRPAAASPSRPPPTTYTRTTYSAPPRSSNQCGRRLARAGARSSWSEIFHVEAGVATPERRRSMPEGRRARPEWHNEVRRPEGQQAVDGRAQRTRTCCIARRRCRRGGLGLGDERSERRAAAGGHIDRVHTGGAEAAAGAAAAGGTGTAACAGTGTALGVVAAVGVVPRELWSGGDAGWGTRHDGQAAGAG